MGEEDVRSALESLEADGQLRRCEIAGRDACYLAELCEAEEYVSRRLLSLASSAPAGAVDVDPLIARLEAASSLTYAPAQRQTIALASRCRVMAITGGPGTGKTTSVRAILSVFDSLGIKTLLTAPTGRAAKRMSELTLREASTIHRLLGAGFSPEGEQVVFAHDEDDPLDCGAVILDECSMVVHNTYEGPAGRPAGGLPADTGGRCRPAAQRGARQRVRRHTALRRHPLHRPQGHLPPGGGQPHSAQRPH